MQMETLFPFYLPIHFMKSELLSYHLSTGEKTDLLGWDVGGRAEQKVSGYLRGQGCCTVFSNGLLDGVSERD